jgi:hypothetical protein
MATALNHGGSARLLADLSNRVQGPQHSSSRFLQGLLCVAIGCLLGKQKVAVQKEFT